MAEESKESLKTKGQLSIVTTYPKILTDEFRRAFEHKHPHIEISITKKKTGASVKYIEATSTQNDTDLFWASSPAAMEQLKKVDRLERYKPVSRGIPSEVAGYPVNDPDGFYTGFAASGYGVMWNERYLSSVNIKEPREWEDLTSPEFYNHVGMSSPSRSGTTHLAMEIILQSYGWNDGWALIKEIGGNLKTVTNKSADVPAGVKVGKFGAGIVIDFYGLGARARHHPVDFAYPSNTSMVPANIALIKDAPNPEAAKMFIEFLLSKEGQTLLLGKETSRLPLRSEVYIRAADKYPNPFTDKHLKDKPKFDLHLSTGRYNLVNALFDNMVTFNLERLKKVTAVIHDVEGKLAHRGDAEVRSLIDEAKLLILYLPVPENLSKEKQFADIFKTKRKKATDKLEGKQKEVETEWFTKIRYNYNRALELSVLALKRMEKLEKQAKGT